MFNFGTQELFLILIIALVIFGPVKALMNSKMLLAVIKK